MNLFKKILKWAAFAFAAFCAFCIIVVTCSDNKSQKQTAQNQASESFLGTYEVADKAGKTFKITLNGDKTAKVIALGKKETVFYCSWEDLRSIDKGIRIDFSDEMPYIKYAGGVDTYGSTLYLRESWVYTSYGVEAKNPKWRLEAKKVDVTP